MANRKATFAKRQRETDLKDRAKAKEDRRQQKRSEVRDNKGPVIAWDEAVRAVDSTDDALPPLGAANRGRDPDQDDADGAEDAPPADADTPSALSTGPIKPIGAPPARPSASPVTAPAPAAPRRVG